MKEIDEAKSIIYLKKIIIDKLNFERFSDDVTKIDDETKIGFYHSVNQLEEVTFRVSLGASIISEAKYDIRVQISGIFSITKDFALGRKILKNNTIAILFPYLRSQLTLLSSQPGFEPIILPVMNINALMDDEN